MKHLFSRLSLGAASIFLAASSYAYVDMNDRLETLENEMQEISARNPQNTLGAGFTTSRPTTVGNNWFSTLSIIYWHPKMGGTEYAYTNTLDNIVFTVSRGPNQQTNTFTVQRPNPPHGDVKANDFGWDVGLKAGIGYKTPHDNWDVFARYTWINAEDTATNRKDVPSIMIALKSLSALIAGRVKSNVNIDYNNIEVELARAYFLSSKFSIRPHIDMKATWLDLEQNITYTFSDYRSTSFSGLDFKVKHDCKIWGLGPRAGIDGKVFVGNGFSLHGEIAGSILYGYFKTRHKENWPLLQRSETVTVGGKYYSIKDKFHQFIPFVQMFMGLGWDSFLNNDRQHLSLKAGYEVQYYWRVNQMSNVDQSLSYSTSSPITRANGFQNGGFRTNSQKLSEDLMFYGITGEVRLDF
ncbi:MAG: MOMP family protein [Simkaniaceae bacterium]|nr:MAG: MOMP family protein [Simkaniaceae bacterium]